MSSSLVVTRHPALLAYLIEIGLVPAGTHALAHATPDDVRGRRVIGVLPHHLSSLTSSVVEIPLDIPAELRGVELTLEQVRQYAGAPREYAVRPLGEDGLLPVMDALALIETNAAWASQGEPCDLDLYKTVRVLREFFDGRAV